MAEPVDTPSEGMLVGENPDGFFASGLDLAQSRYNFNYTVFPEDLGMDYQGHYMVININVPTKGIKSSGLALGQAAGAYTSYFTEVDNVSKLDVLRYGKYKIPGAPNAALAPTLGGFSLPNPLPFGPENFDIPSIPFSLARNTRRIAESIALFMPTPLIFNQQNAYEEVSLTALAGKLTVGASATELARTASQIGQTPINPLVEIIFATSVQRTFTFEVLMAPRNERESWAIKKIIQTIRFHGAPEINNSPGLGALWIPPADFDITFFNKGVENTNILRINTCVLERCEVDYSPTSGIYSTFRNGHPVAVRLSLGFRELEPIHKARVVAGF
jgi:hypothetical protein